MKQPRHAIKDSFISKGMRRLLTQTHRFSLSLIIMMGQWKQFYWQKTTLECVIATTKLIQKFFIPECARDCKNLLSFLI